MKKINEFKLIFSYMGFIVVFAGLIMFMPLTLLLFYPSEITQVKYFLIPGLLSVFFGGLLVHQSKSLRKSATLRGNNDSIIVALSWLVAILVSAIPIALLKDYNYLHAVFEATSGYSTTGLSVVKIDEASNMLFLYRSLLQFFGGIGLVLVLMSFISDKFGMKLYTAEGHNDKLFPHLLHSSRLIFTIYSGYVLAGTIIYTVLGMSVFDALNHSIAAFATGGFSTHVESIAYFNSPAIEYATIIFMLLGGTNFYIHLLLLNGKFKAVFSHCETVLVVWILSIFTPIVLVLLVTNLNMGISESFRSGLFQITSALTGTGFSTVANFKTWPSAALFVLILMQILGGGAGSTAGGIKQYRISIIMKQFYWNIRNAFSNKRVKRAQYLNRRGEVGIVDQTEIVNTLTFANIYILVFIIGSIIFMCFGYSITDSMFEFSSALGTVGLSIGVVTYSSNPVILITSIVGMYLGRLEFIVVFIAIAQVVKNIKNK